MFPLTVAHGSKERPYSRNTMASPAGTPCTISPWNLIVPPVGSSSPASALSSVVLPQPEGPTIETISPALMTEEQFCPAIPITTYRKIDEAIARANDIISDCVPRSGALRPIARWASRDTWKPAPYSSIHTASRALIAARLTAA